MAQVRIDEALLTDIRFKMLAQKLDADDGMGEALAIEVFLKACFLAQRYWRDNRKLVPLKIWNFDPRFALLIECDLAKQNGEEVYLNGSSAFFDWYHSKKEAGRAGGLKSGISRRKKKEGKAGKSKQTKQTNEASEAETRSNEPASVSVSVSVSDSVSVSEATNLKHSCSEQSSPPPITLDQINDPPPKPKRKKPEPTAGALVWAAYSEAYRYRYRVDPKRNAKVNKNCADLVGRLGGEDAVKVVEFYLTHNDSWYVKNSHAIGYCLRDAESLHSQMLRNSRVTSTEAHRIDKGASQAEIFAKVTRELEAKYEGQQ